MKEFTSGEVTIIRVYQRGLKGGSLETIRALQEELSKSHIREEVRSMLQEMIDRARKKTFKDINLKTRA